MNAIIKKIEDENFLINPKNKPLMIEDLDILGIKKDSLFYELYTTYFSFAIGNGAELFSLEQLMEYNNPELSHIMFASDDGGTLIYNKETDEVFEYNGVFSSNEAFGLAQYENSWETFELFLNHYYEN